MTSTIETTCRALYECISRIRKAGKHRKLTAELQERLGEHLYQLENENKSLKAGLDEALNQVDIYGDAHRYQVKLTHEACCRERALFDDLHETRRLLAIADSDCGNAQEIVDRQKERIHQHKVLIAAQRQAIGQLYMLKGVMSRQITGLLEENDILKMANKAAGEELRSKRCPRIVHCAPSAGGRVILSAQTGPTIVSNGAGYPGPGAGAVNNGVGTGAVRHGVGAGGSGSGGGAGRAGANRKCNNQNHHENCQCGQL